MHTNHRYFTIEKSVGETPLEALERGRLLYEISSETPLAYAGRLDPMASGKLLILIGDECKHQEKYHTLDKEYQVDILLGASSDTGDVLGLITHREARLYTSKEVQDVLEKHIGKITLPYPHFSSKTVQGKPLHMWTLEGRLDEITIPTKTSYIHRITLNDLRTISKAEILDTVRQKIETIPRVTDPRKALGADFRREHVRASWNTFAENGASEFQVISITCVASSGTYMRSLAESIGTTLGTRALAYSIHRTKIGTYFRVFPPFGFFTHTF